MLRRMLLASTCLLLTLGNASCGSKDSVALSVFISDADLSVEQGTLGARLGGSFVLNLELGPEAPNSTSVSLENFSVAPAGGTGDLVPGFAPESTETFPLTLAAGERRKLTLTVPDDDTLASDELDALCAGEVEIRGSLRDSLGGDSVTAVRSNALSVTGCP